MDIKLRSNDSAGGEADILKPDSRRKSRLRGIVLFFAIALGIGCVYAATTNLLWYGNHKYLFSERDPYEILDNTGHMKENLFRYAKNLHRFYVYFGGAGYEALPPSERLSAGDLAAAREELVSQSRDDFIELQERMNADEYYTRFDLLMAGMGELYEKYNISDDELRERVLEAKDQNYEDIAAYLAAETRFGYYIEDAKGQRYTNMPEISDIESYVQNVLYSGMYYCAPALHNWIFSQTQFTGETLSQAFERDGFTGYIFVRRSNPPTDMDQEWDRVVQYNRMTDRSPEYWVLLAAGLVFLLVITAAALRNLQLVIRANIFLYKLYSRLPFVVKAGAAAMLALTLFNLITSPLDLVKMGFEYGEWIGAALLLTVYGGIAAAVVLTAEYALVTLRYPRGLKSEPEVKWIGAYISCFRYIVLASDIMVWALYVILAVATVLGVVLCVLAYAEVMILPVLLCALFGHFWVGGYAQLVYHIKQMAGGNMDSIPEARGLFAPTLRQLGKVSKGLSRAVEDMIKSERLKTELITNVSHDLKTPLTSIINYVALLKEQPSQSAEAAEYIDILDKKSERLGVLIEDLFEASKLQSGSMELVKERVDLVNLLNQAMGELNEKIEAAGIDFRFRHTPEHIYYDCDGNKMWRAFDNILGNIIKYAATGSRAYIQAAETASGVRLTFKNVSAYELDISAEELFDRFKRGDSARATEGSGLGLAIARGVVELHGGRMTIEVDGDLFKVVVEL